MIVIPVQQAPSVGAPSRRDTEVIPEQIGIQLLTVLSPFPFFFSLLVGAAPPPRWFKILTIHKPKTYILRGIPMTVNCREERSKFYDLCVTCYGKVKGLRPGIKEERGQERLRTKGKGERGKEDQNLKPSMTGGKQES